MEPVWAWPKVILLSGVYLLYVKFEILNFEIQTFAISPFISFYKKKLVRKSEIKLFTEWFD